MKVCIIITYQYVTKKNKNGRKIKKEKRNIRTVQLMSQEETDRHALKIFACLECICMPQKVGNIFKSE
jgi:hypothetical protein